MSETITNPFEPGTLISVAGLCELPRLEDYVAITIYPRMPIQGITDWRARMKAENIIRKDNFVGSIGKITLRVMTDPVDRFEEACSTGGQFDTEHNGQNKGSLLKAMRTLPEDRVIGFDFFAEETNPHLRSRQPITAGMWYFVTGSYSPEKDKFNRFRMNQARIIDRRISKPKPVDPELFEQVSGSHLTVPNITTILANKKHQERLLASR